MVCFSSSRSRFISASISSEGWEHQEEVLVWECDVLSLPNELGVRDASKLCCWWSRPSDPLDSRAGYRSVLLRGAEPMNDMSDDSGSENSGNAFRAEPALCPVVLENGDLSATEGHSHSTMLFVRSGCVALHPYMAATTRVINCMRATLT
jgi:hypothetical protein